MMKHEIRAVFGMIFILSVTVLLNYSCSDKPDNKDNSNTNISVILSIDDIIENPEKYTGMIRVSGKSANADSLHSTFELGCDDACFFMPVEYKGKLPADGSEIIVYGRIIRNNDNKFIFRAQEYKAR